MSPVESYVAPAVPPSRDGVVRGAPHSRQTPAQAEAILRAIPDMMFRMTREGVYLDFKAEREAELYVPADQIVGHRVDELLPTDLSTTILELIGEVLDSGELRTMEYELEKQAGLRSYETRISVSGPDEVVAIVRDVTDAKLAQRELRQTAERLKTVLGNLPVVLFALDVDGRFTLSEGKGLENLGILPGDMLGKSALEAYADAPDIIASFRRALAGEEFMTSRDYNGRSLETRYAPLRDEGGALTGTIGVTVDVTEQVLAERALVASESRFRLLMEHSNDVLCELRDGRFTYLSPNCLELSGKPPEYYIGRTPGELAHPSDLPKLASILAPGWTGHISATFRVRHADGDWRWREVSGVRIIEDGCPRAVVVMRDIDARVKAEEAARSLEQKYQRLVDNAQDSVYTHDVDGNFTSVNPMSSVLYGYTRDEFLSMNISQLLDSEYLPLAIAEMQKALGGQSVATPLEFLTYRKDGSPLWVEVVASPILDDGAMIGFQGISRDVTERKRAEQALVKSEERLREVVQGAQDVIYTTDLAGLILSVNPAIERVLGYTPAEVIGLTTRDLVHESQLEALAENYAEWRRSGKMEGNGEWLVRAKDGSPVWIETAATALKEDGQPVGLLVIGRDVTERKQAEERVQFQAQLLDLVSQAVIVTDLQGKLTFLNGFAEGLFGWTAEQALGRQLSELAHPIHRSRAIALTERIARGEQWTGEITTTRRSGEMFPALVSAAPIFDTAGQRSGGVCVIADISELRRTEREMHHAEERAAVHSERARIAQELHDSVAQYFFGIGIAAKDILERKPVRPAMLQRRLTDIRKLSTQGGHEVRNAVYALSSTEPSDGLDVSLTRLCATFEEVAGVTVQYRNDLAMALTPPIARELYSAAREALYNVRKHASASTISIRLVGDADRTTLEVSDDGIGTALAVNDAIAAGGGFGLRSMSERFALLGGRVEVIDGEHAGVTVCCTLPRAAA